MAQMVCPDKLRQIDLQRSLTYTFLVPQQLAINTICVDFFAPVNALHMEIEQIVKCSNTAIPLFVRLTPPGSFFRMSQKANKLKPIQEQFVLILAGTLVGFLLISITSSFLFFWPTFERQDTQFSINNALRVFHLWRSNAEQLDQKITEWSIWDDSYEFVQNGDSEFVSSNIAANTFTNIAITDLLFMRPDGITVWSGAISADGTQIEPLSEMLLAVVQQQNNGKINEWSGLVSVGGKLRLISIRGITDTEGKAEPAGIIAMASEVDDDYLHSMREELRIDFSIKYVEDNGRGLDLNEAELKQIGAEATDNFTRFDSEKGNIVSFQLALLGEKRTLAIDTYSKKVLTTEAGSLFLWNAVSVLFSALLMMAVIAAIFRKKVVQPLTDISEKIEDWESSDRNTLELHHHESLEIGRISTAIVAMYDRIMKIASHDQLTGLPNRLLLKNRFVQSIARAQRQDTFFAIIYFDLDGFKAINDNLGHQSGDVVLKTIANRLANCIRTTDTVARMGGDEFLVLFEPVNNSREEVEKLCERILIEIETPISVAGTACKSSASLGIALFPHDAIGSEELIKLADQAMYSAKEKGKSMYCFARP